jgi:hypothetical protein
MMKMRQPIENPNPPQLPMKTILLLTCLYLTACGNAPTPETEVGIPEPIQAVLSSPVSEADAIPIPEARSTAAPGDEVILAGRIMGVMNPFIEGRAVFILGENGIITPCSDMATDHCDTPWDACCDPSEVRVNGTASIQILDESGSVVKQGLEGVSGLEKLSTVKVVGTVDPASSPESLIVNATAIEVGP